MERNNRIPRPVLSQPISSNAKPSFFKQLNMKYIILFILLVLLISILIYISISYISYSKTECIRKKDFFLYLFDFSDPDVCIPDINPILEEKIEDIQKPPETLIQSILHPKEVFHIANQEYTYEQSKCKCESYGARLATKNEVIESYNKGAHWCTYGWSEGQHAYYPVQKCEWDKMVAENDRFSEKHKKYCGIPGVNGGHFSNPELKFGVNCYGIKPKGIVVKEKDATCNKEHHFCQMNQNFNASHKLKSDEITGFNNDKWSEYK